MRVRIPGLKKRIFLKKTSLCFFLSRSSRQKSIVQGPELPSSLVWCLFVCLCHAWRYPVSVPYRIAQLAICWLPYLSRTVPYHQTQLATNSWPQYYVHVYDSMCVAYVLEGDGCTFCSSFLSEFSVVPLTSLAKGVALGPPELPLAYF